jgi:hypothetical protein
VAGSIGTTSPDSLLSYARAQVYDTLESVGDEQFLTEGTCGANCRPGPRAAIQPQVETFRYRRTDIAGGRVIARIVNRDSLAYPALNLAPRDTAYWFVDSAASGWRSTFISSSKGSQPVSRPLTIERHPGQPHTQALARWKLTAAGVPVPWQSCVDEGCCR